MKKYTIGEAVLLSAAVLALLPREIRVDRSEAESGKAKLTRFALKTILFGVDISDAGDGKKSVGLSILPQSETVGTKVSELSGKIREKRIARSEKKKERQLRPLFKNALELVSKKGTASAEYLSKKLRVGLSCGEAFLEIMEEMGIVAPAGDGKYRVILPKKKIDDLIAQG